MNLGTILLAIWLILTGLAAFVRIPIPNRDRLMAGLALLAGLFLLIRV